MHTTKLKILQKKSDGLSVLDLIFKTASQKRCGFYLFLLQKVSNSCIL